MTAFGAELASDESTIAEEIRYQLFRTDKPVGMFLFPIVDVIAFAGFIAV